MRQQRAEDATHDLHEDVGRDIADLGLAPQGQRDGDGRVEMGP